MSVPLRPSAATPTRCPRSVSAAITSASSIPSAEAVRIVHAAIDAGITFLDNAWEYHEGESEQRMGKRHQDRRDSVFLMTKVCTHGRDAKTAMRQLERVAAAPADRPSGSVAGPRMRLRQRSGPPFRQRRRHRGARAGEDAGQGAVCRLHRPQGSADSSARCCRIGFPFDACQLPLNGFDADFRSFRTQVLPELPAAGSRRSA